MADFERKEAEKRDAERSKNDLEAYIISTGGILEDGAYDEVFCHFTLSQLVFCRDTSLKQHASSSMNQTLVSRFGEGLP